MSFAQCEINVTAPGKVKLTDASTPAAIIVAFDAQLRPCLMATPSFLPGAPQFRRRARLQHDLEVEDTRPKGVELIGADDRVAGHARLPGTRRDLGDGLAREALPVEPPLAGHHRVGRAHAAVEIEQVERERGSRNELGSELGP